MARTAKSQMPGWRYIPSRKAVVSHLSISLPRQATCQISRKRTVEFTDGPKGTAIVIISHGEGYQTKYGHLPGNSFNRAKVSRGESIVTGESGNATGPHCHFELEAGGQAVIQRITCPERRPRDPYHRQPRAHMLIRHLKPRQKHKRMDEVR